MTEVRCDECHKLLYKTYEITDDGMLEFDRKVNLNACTIGEGKILAIEIKCPRCGHINKKTT